MDTDERKENHIRILQVVNGMNMGGIENYIINILRNIDRNQYKVDFLYATDKECYFDREINKYGCSIFRITGRNKNLFRHLKDLSSFFYTHNEYDVVHIHYNLSFCFTVARAAKKAGIKKIIVHSHNTSGRHRIIHNIFKPMLDIYANVHCACSTEAANWMFTKKSNKKGVTLLYNAINSESYIFDEARRKKIRDEFNLGERFIVGHIGRFSYQKNHQFLLEIFNSLKKINEDAVLLLIGEGELMNEIDMKISSLELSDSVIKLGIRKDVDELLSAFDVFVFPSFFEGLPVTLVEVQANGLSCLASDNISKEVCFTDLINFMSLEQMPEDWVSKIRTTDKNIRSDYNKQIAKTRFNIENEVEVIQNLYRGDY